MVDLTEQWKKGELDIDECYFAETEGGIYKATGEYLNNSSCINGFDITSILEPVQSYDEWKEKLEENEKLKELLKENAITINIKTQIITAFKELLKELRMSVMFDKDLVDKIDEVLNE